MNAERWVTAKPLELEPLLEETEHDGCGALQVFAGTVRDTNAGRCVDGMTYEAHVGLAAQTLRDLEQETKTKFGVPVCRIQHRIGELSLGEVSVYIVVRSPHRASSFDAARYAIDTLKKVTPIWKHEHYSDGDSEYLEGTPLRAPTSSESTDHSTPDAEIRQ